MPSRERSDSGSAPGPSRLPPEPRRGAEAIANFYGRYSTDQGSARNKFTDASFPNSISNLRRSSIGASSSSQSNEIDDVEHEFDASSSNASGSKGPRLYNSFSAAAAAASASRSSLNKRPSEAAFSLGSPGRVSGQHSPALSSPQTSSTGAATPNMHRRNTSGGRKINFGIPGISAAPVSMDDALNHSSTGSQRMQSSLSAGQSSSPRSASRRTSDLSLKDSHQGLSSPRATMPSFFASPSPWIATSSASPRPPPLPSQDHEIDPKQRIPAAEAVSGLGIDSSPDVSQFSKGKGFGWNHDQDQKASKASGRVRTGSSTKTKATDPRDGLGRALGVKSSSELDLPERMRNQRKGLPAPPRLSQDPIAISIAEELGATNQPRTPKSESAFARLGRAFRRKSKTGSDLRVDTNAEAAAAPPLPKTPRNISSRPSLSSRKPSVPEAAPLVVLSAVNATSQDSNHAKEEFPRERGGSQLPDREASQAGGAVPATENAAVMRLNGSEDSAQEDQPAADQGGKDQPDLNVDEVPLSTDSDYVLAQSQPSTPTPRVNGARSRPMSTDSMTSSAHRRSLAFLASAISMGAIADVGKEGETAGEQAESQDTVELSRPHTALGTIDTEKEDEDEGDIDNSRPSLTSMPVTVSRSSSSSSIPHQRRTASKDEAPIIAARSSKRSRLVAKSATRDDHIPSILSDFIDMDAKESRKGKSQAQPLSIDTAQSKGNGSQARDEPDSTVRPSSTRSLSGNSDGHKSSLSSSPKAVRATKGVFMSPPAGPNMGGYVSPFYVAPLTSVDSGLANKGGRTSGRRASAGSKSINSDDSHAVKGGGGQRRGSSSLAVPENTVQDSSPSHVESAKGGQAESSREFTNVEKARKVKSHGNLRMSAQGAAQEALPRASTSRLPSQASLSSGPSAFGEVQVVSPVSEHKASPFSNKGSSREDGAARTPSLGQRLLRRPKTSAADSQTGSSLFRGPNQIMKQSSQAVLPRRGSGPGRASLDEAAQRKRGAASPSEADFELLDSYDSLARLKSADGSAQPRKGSATSFDSLSHSRHLLSERRDSSGLGGRRGSETNGGASTPSSSRLESQGGAASLFGNTNARPRTSSLLPSFGFSRNRTGSSSGLEGTGKSPGKFGGGARSASAAQPRDSTDVFLTPQNEKGDALASSNDDSSSAQPRVSAGSSRPSLNRQRSAANTLVESEAETPTKTEKKFSASAFLPYDDESAEEYAERISDTAPKNQIAAILASSSDTFYIEALGHYMTRFWFNGIPLDIALRKLLMDLHLPKETQQIDRVMEAFARRYNECNSGLFASDDQPYILAFSLMMLHTDAFNKNAKNKMTKADYLRNTGSSGVPTEILEYLYDNLTFTQFIYVEDEDNLQRRASEHSSASVIGGTTVSALSQPNAGAGNRMKIDPYFLIAQGRLGELRPDLEHLIPEDSPFSYTGTLSSFDVDRLNAAFLHAPSIEIVTTKTSNEESGAVVPPSGGEEEVVSLKVTKVGIVNRKDDMSDGGKKAGSRKWKTSGLLLTGSQLLLFKDIVWINALQSQILDQVGHSLLSNGIHSGEQDDLSNYVEGGIVISPRITYFRPDGVISLADAVAVKDHSYGKYDFVFRLLAAKGRQYLVQAQSEDDMNDWIHKINFCASFRTANIKIRGLDLAPRVGSGSADADRPGRDPSMDRYSARPRPSQSSLSDMDPPVGYDIESPARQSTGPSGNADDSGDGTAETTADSLGREGEGPIRPGSSASQRRSPASSALRKRVAARKELMLTKIAETETQLEQTQKRLHEEIRLARHFAILTPFLKSTRDRIEFSALPLSSKIRSLRLEVAKAESRCKILRLDLAAGERVARRLMPSMYLSTSDLRAASKMPGSQVATPQLLAMGGITESQAQFEEIFGPGVDGSNQSASSSLMSGKVTKPASHQRNQMNLNAVSEQPADESPVMSAPAQMTGDSSFLSNPPADSEASADVDVRGRLEAQKQRSTNSKSRSPAQSAASSRSSVDSQKREGRGEAERADEVPEDWDLSQVARQGSNRISLVDLPSPNELQEATERKFKSRTSQE